ncbi:MAG TPA: hypothetical protein VFV10_20580 [Gammaproteobacteria bacterium]|nr:hypothetical protein [Gammaproteobacteria bacterium]
MRELATSALASSWPGGLAAHALGPADLGVAYVFLLLNAAVTALAFVAARRFLVISPNRGARDYGLYTSGLLAALIVAAVLDSELASPSPVLPLAVVPHVAILLVIHACIYYRQAPWMVALGLAAVVGAAVTLGVAGLEGAPLGIAHGVSVLLLAALVALLWRTSIATRWAYANARSIYVESKEGVEPGPRREALWLGVPQWISLVTASLAVGVLNAVLRGSRLADVPAATVVVQGAELLAVTAAVCSVPALSYWYARRSSMPGIDRFVWLVFLVVGFAFTYGSYLASLGAA